MRPRNAIGLFCFAALAFTLVAGSCDMVTSVVQLADLDQALKPYQNGVWDGVKGSAVKYVKNVSPHVDAWSKQSAVTYASLMHAQHVVNVAGNHLVALKKSPNPAARQLAQQQVKTAQTVLERAIANGPKLLQQGKDMVTNYKSLISDPTKAPALIESLQGSVENLSKTAQAAPDVVKKLAHIATQLATL